ncbi:MAG TPA: CDP-diacylglycerol--glycerol-3-phosphate 3-phosphatidyltransferase [Planctomycetaceae bacterium]|nr:CDP-diacylglycerol--glycerol-3-phosphate 3-phosphatidyltransferase [Planctomycetaceae bacterium]
MSVAEGDKPVVAENADERSGIFDRKALNLPNTITLIRFVMAVVLFALIYLDGYWQTAAILFVVAASTDFLDGYVARKYQQITILGRILDPFVDKIIICGSFIFLIGQEQSGVNAWMAIIVVGREMFVSTLRGLLEQQGLDFSANWIGKIKMAAQCAAVTGSLIFLALPPESQTDANYMLARDLLLWGVVLFTAYSGIAYVLRASQLLAESARSAKSPEGN